MNFQTKSFKTPLGKLVLKEASLSHARGLNDVINEGGVNEFVLVEKPVSLSSTIKAIKEKSGNWVVAMLDGMVVGSVSLHFKEGRKKHVADFGIAFSKKVHGKGIAKLVMNTVFDYAAKNGVEIISSCVFSDNKRARSFYKKEGFREVGISKNHLKRDGKYLAEILIVKTIS